MASPINKATIFKTSWKWFVMGEGHMGEDDQTAEYINPVGMALWQKKKVKRQRNPPVGGWSYCFVV
jgi:hypothetical protein